MDAALGASGQMDLTAIEQIKQLKHRYFRSLDLKQWDTFGDCLTADVTARYGTQAMGAPTHFDGRSAVVAFMTENLGGDVVTVHLAHHPEIEVDGDRARASWAFEDTVLVPAHQVQIRGAGYYTDEYRRGDDGRWRISVTAYERIYEVMTSLDDTPSLTWLANRWA